MDVEQLIDMHKDQLYRLCLYLEKNQDKADDLFQDTWVKAIERLATYDKTKAFYPWLTQIAVNNYRDKLRRLKLEIKRRCYEPEAVIQDRKSEEESIESQLVHKEELQCVQQALQRLGDKHRLPLILTMGERMSYKEAGEILDINEGLVKSRVYEARQKLKKLLEKEGL
ncbi:RNA polymerase sigma factor [Niameybacter massiliensis]|uniref:RNA polymerase sigma factor n=1 Tax=Holtiella tumoricola TaxID=3018743 RepID=A0AA42DL93_9FIRM|nr:MULTISPECIES: RNA polymerase sigma factor [Lachnospirales]MDA3731160.1 RNA polymerase sigma factor [Holtiella tumoricola]